MENENKEIENIQEELKYKIITLEDEAEDSKIKKVIDDLVQDLNETFEKFKSWYEQNKDSEKAQEIKEKFIEEMNSFVNKASSFINDLKNNPEVSEKIDAGVQTIKELSRRIADSIGSGVNNILENENVAKTIDTVSDKVVEVLKDERVQSSLKATKKGILDVASKAYEGLKNMLGDIDEAKDAEDITIQDEIENKVEE